MARSQQSLAKLAGIWSGLVFGIYWIPLRALDASGFAGMWAIVLFNLVAMALVAPYILYKWRLLPGRRVMHINAMGTGVAFVLYAGAFLYTEVIRAVSLFYLMPVWGFIFGHFLLGERITGIRWLSMALGLGGLIIICGVEDGFPLPANTGDWMALGAGILWALMSCLIMKDHKEPVTYAMAFLFWTLVASLIAAFIATHSGALPAPDWSGLRSILIWLVPFGVVVIVPGALATLYAPAYLNPGVVGLFFMIEISVGTVTAALFADEPFGSREIAGVLLITMAGIAETLYERIQRKPLAPP